MHRIPIDSSSQAALALARGHRDDLVFLADATRKRLQKEYIPPYIRFLKNLPIFPAVPDFAKAIVLALVMFIIFFSGSLLSSYGKQAIETWYFYVPYAHIALHFFFYPRGFHMLVRLVDDLLELLTSPRQFAEIDRALQLTLVSDRQHLLCAVLGSLLVLVGILGDRFAPEPMQCSPLLVKNIGYAEAFIMAFVSGYALWASIGLMRLVHIVCSFDELDFNIVSSQNTVAIRNLSRFMGTLSIYGSIMMSPAIVAIVFIPWQSKPALFHLLISSWIVFVLPLILLNFWLPQVSISNLVGRLKTRTLLQIEHRIGEIYHSCQIDSIDQLQLLDQYNEMHKRIIGGRPFGIDLDLLGRLVSSLLIPTLIYILEDSNRVQVVRILLERIFP